MDGSVESEVYYHGTSSTYLESIKKYGILPNSDAKAKPNWRTEIDNSINFLSRINNIYLTTDFETAKEFAQWSAKESDGFPIVLEIPKSALNGAKLIPDENLNGFDEPLLGFIKPTSFRVEGIMIKRFKVLDANYLSWVSQIL